MLKLLRLGAAALKPAKMDNGKWRGAELSAKTVAQLRKDTRLMGRCALSAPLARSDARSEWPYEEPRAPSTIFQRQLKGHRVDREKPMREARIVAGLAKQDELLAARAKARAPKPGPEAFLDAELLTVKELRIKNRGVSASKGS